MSKKTKPTQKNKPTLAVLLLDRTGSMESCKKETITGFNAYIKKLQDESDKDARFSMTQFDSQGIDQLYDAVPLKDVASLNDETFQPRAWTPLFDALGKTIRAAEAKAGDKYKVLFITMTDGMENASTEWTKDMVNALIKEKEDKAAWTFVHIGVGIQGWQGVHSYSVGTRSFTNAIHIDPKDAGRVMARAGGQSVGYMKCAFTASVPDTAFWEEKKKKQEKK